MGVASSPSDFHEVRDGQDPLVDRMAKAAKKQREECS